MKKILCCFMISMALISCVPEPTTSLPTELPHFPTSVPKNLPESTKVPTLIPSLIFTNTPTGIEINGRLFLDANGSSIQDDAVLFCPVSKAVSPALEYYFPGICNGKSGQIVTRKEPALSGLKLCIQQNCTITEVDGSFSLKIQSADKDTSLMITDPNYGNPALELRYLNRFNKNVQVSEASCNGIKYPPKTVLDASILPISQGIPVIPGKNAPVGLMQGLYTAPFDIATIPVHIWNGYDIDGSAPYVRDGKQANYFGLKTNGSPGSKEGVNDSHAALDFSIKPGTPALTMASGELLQTHNFENGWNLTYHLSGTKVFESIQYGHLQETPAFQQNNSMKVYRGQIIACTGNSAMQNGEFFNQLHVQFNVGSNGVQTDPFRNMTGEYYPLGSPISRWSIDNTLVSPIPGNP